MNYKKSILRNYVKSEDYDEGSFIGLLHEQSVWSFDEYFLLEWAIYQWRNNNDNSTELDPAIFPIFSYLSLLISANFDDNDDFLVANLSANEMYNMRDRVYLIFGEYFSGRISQKSITSEPINPFFKKDEI